MNTCPKCQKAEPFQPCACGKCPPVVLAPGNMVLCHHCRGLILYTADGFVVPTTEEKRAMFDALHESIVPLVNSPHFEVSVVHDSFDYCWDVLLDNGFCALATQWPRDIKPTVGDPVFQKSRNEVIWRGRSVPIDVRRLRPDENGDVYFD